MMFSIKLFIMKKKLLYNVIAFALLSFPNLTFGQVLNLGKVESFLAYSTRGAVSNTNTAFVNSSFQGDVGTDVGAVTGFGASSAPNSSVSFLGGNLENQNSLTKQVKEDLLNIYIHLCDVPVTHPSPAHPVAHGLAFGGETLLPGVYLMNGAGTFTGNLTLDGGGDPNAFYIFKFNGAFTAAIGSKVILTNGASSKNIFWIAEGAITVGASAVMKGTLIAHPGAISVGDGASIEGRVLSTEGAISFYAGDSTIPVGLATIPISCTNFCANPMMGTAANFVLFSSFGDVSNGGTSGFIGDIGTNSGAVTNLAGATYIGAVHEQDSTTAQAALDVLSAYNQLKAVPNTVEDHTPAFGSGETLTPGVYSINAAGSLAGTLTLDGKNDQNALFIFKFNGAFSTEAQSKVILVNGARRCNVFWIAVGAISQGTFTHMKGNLIANPGANSMGANGNLEGGMYSTSGAVSFSTGVIYNQYSLCNKIIIANPDTGINVNGTSGGTSFVNVLNNDRLDGQVFQPSQVELSLVSATPTNDTTLNVTNKIYLDGGNVLVAPGTPAGNYILTYRICEVANPGNCAQTYVTITVTAAPILAVDDTIN
ncbi:DUF3494 domain-containing protein, partial [Flavobacterium sp. GT3P67]